MTDIGTIASILSATAALLVLYFSRRDKRFDEIGRRIDVVDKRIDEVKDDLGKRIDEVKDEMRSFRKEIIEELRSFRLEFRNAVHEIEADTIDIDKRLIVLETVREESKRSSATTKPEPKIIQRRTRRRPKA